MSNRGLLYGFFAYLIWGFFPIYFKQVQTVPAIQIIGHRFFWSFVVLVLIVTIKGDWREILSSLSLRVFGIYTLAGSLLAINWLTYVWGVNAGFVVETSLGYFINPLVNVVLGVLFLRERLRPMQWLPVGLATAGVLYLTVSYRTLPWIALVLALSFGSYGLVKKMASLGSLHGLMVETSALLIPAFGFLLFVNAQGTGMFGHLNRTTDILLILTGVVTVVPLLFFGTAVRQVPYWVMGLIQFITPTCQFLLGVFVYHEPFDFSRLIGFAFVWLGLIVFIGEGFWARRPDVLAYK